jgi:acyl-homoserine-lactone acylase
MPHHLQSGSSIQNAGVGQRKMYANGIFKDVLFYKEDVLKHVERKYHPGECLMNIQL